MKTGVEEAKVGFAFALPTLQLGSAATTKRGPPGMTYCDNGNCGLVR